jgi:hypothetical protein
VVRHWSVSQALANADVMNNLRPHDHDMRE